MPFSRTACWCRRALWWSLLRACRFNERYTIVVVRVKPPSWMMLVQLGRTTIGIDKIVRTRPDVKPMIIRLDGKDCETLL